MSVENTIRWLVSRARNVVLRFTTTAEGSGDLAGDTWGGDSHQGAEHLQSYGFTSSPPKGSRGIRLIVAGDHGHDVAICVGGDRPGMASGEVMLHSSHGQTFHMKADGTIEIKNGAGTTVIEVLADGTCTIAEGTQFPALGNLVSAELTTLKSAISSAATAPNDGGATFKAAIVAALSAWPGSVAATKTRVG